MTQKDILKKWRQDHCHYYDYIGQLPLPISIEEILE